VLIAVMVGGAGVRHMMNTRYRGEGRTLPVAAWLVPAGGMAAIAVVHPGIETRISAPADAVVDHPVGFARVQEIIVQRCVRCHSRHPEDEQFPAPPNGVVFETTEQIKTMVPRIHERAVKNQTMPFLNRTNMTPLERAELGRWIADGAHLQ